MGKSCREQRLNYKNVQVWLVETWKTHNSLKNICATKNIIRIFKQSLTKHQIYIQQRGVLTTHSYRIKLIENFKIMMWDPQTFVISNKFHSIRGPKHFPTTKHKSQRHEELPRQYSTQRRNKEVQSISWITQKSYTHITHKTKPWVQKKTDIKFKGTKIWKFLCLKSLC